MIKRLKRLHWLDYVLLALIIFAGYIIIDRIGGTLNYNWRWEKIPNYIFRYKESEDRVSYSNNSMGQPKEYHKKCKPADGSYGSCTF